MLLKLTVAFVMIKTNVCNEFYFFNSFYGIKQIAHENNKDNPAQHKGF